VPAGPASTRTERSEGGHGGAWPVAVPSASCERADVSADHDPARHPPDTGPTSGARTPDPEVPEDVNVNPGGDARSAVSALAASRRAGRRARGDSGVITPGWPPLPPGDLGGSLKWRPVDAYPYAKEQAAAFFGVTGIVADCGSTAPQRGRSWWRIPALAGSRGEREGVRSRSGCASLWPPWRLLANHVYEETDARCQAHSLRCGSDKPPSPWPRPTPSLRPEAAGTYDSPLTTPLGIRTAPCGSAGVREGDGW